MVTLLRFAFRKLGRLYPPLVLAFQFGMAHVVVLAGTSLFTLYQDMTTMEFLRILAVAEGLMLIENAFATRLGWSLLKPVRRWLGGARDEDETVRAWRALAALPAEFLRRWKWIPLTFNIPLLSVFATAELDLPWHSGLLILGASFVVLLYGATLRFFATELAMRPILEELSHHLPDGFQVGRGGVPLSWKLLATLPMVSVITGIVVAGFSGSGDAVSDVGVDVLIALAAAFAISLEMTILISRSILAPIRDLREATDRVRQGDLSARVPVVATDETGRLAQSFNQMAAGLQEREELREAFGTFVAPDVAEKVMREGTLLGDDVEVSVLFLDIRDFTAFAERSSAREVVERLNDFYECVVPILARHHGHADKFIGDGLLGVFGAPERRPDHADCAVAAALEIAGLVRDRYGDGLTIGIGVNSGPVVAGTIGGGGRLEFTVIGDPVNTAARVEELTRETGDDVLITEATRCLLTRPLRHLEERPATVLKGKTERVRVYSPALAVAAGDGAGPAPVGGRRAPVP